MKKIIFIAVFLCLFILLPNLSSAKGIDLYSLFPNLTLGFDPGIQDTVYTTCDTLTATTLTIDVRVKTDAAPGDSIQGIFVPLVINADQPGVTLDTTVASAYTGTALQSWDDTVLYVSVTSGGGDPSVFPLNIIVGGVNVNWNPSTVLGAGDHLIAKLRFNVSTPTNICVADTFQSQGNGLMLVTTQANGYTPAFMGGCCGPAVPTLSEWGLILFGVVLFSTLVWYLRRRRHAAAG